MKITGVKCLDGCAYSKSMEQEYPRRCIVCGSRENSNEVKEKMNLDFEKCWKKINGGTSIDREGSPFKKLVKHHCELIYREALKINQAN